MNCWRSTGPASWRDRKYIRSSLRELVRAADDRSSEYLERLDRSDAEDGATHGGAHTENSRRKDRGLAG